MHPYIREHGDRLHLPFIIGGQLIEPGPSDPVTLEYETGHEIVFPRVPPEVVAAIEETPRSLGGLALSDILACLEEVGRAWSAPTYPLRRALVGLSSRVYGASPAVVLRDVELFSGLLTNKYQVLDQIEAELGSRYVLDDWEPRGMSYVTARPRGRVLHVMVGNIPLAPIYSVVRAQLGKNSTLVKLPRRDLLSTLLFLLSFLDVAAESPVTRSISCLYWPHGDTLATELTRVSDTVCVWGGREACESVKKAAPYGTNVLEFGPKRSVSLLRVESAAEAAHCARRLAHDISLYDQEGCFSTQAAYVDASDDGVFDAFLASLEAALDDYLTIYPRARGSADIDAHVNLTRLAEAYLGAEVVGAERAAWTIVVPLDGGRVEHPLSRTVYVHRVGHLADALADIDSTVQSVSYYPWESALALRDALADRGVARLCDVGLSTLPRVGWSHDGMLPLAELVRWVSLERPLDAKTHYANLDDDAKEAVIFRMGQLSLARHQQVVGE